MIRIPIWKNMCLELRLHRKRELSKEEKSFINHVTFINEQAGYEISTSGSWSMSTGDFAESGGTLPSKTNFDVQHLPDDD